MREESELRQRVGQKLKLCPEQYLPIVEGAIDGALKIEKPNEETEGVWTSSVFFLWGRASALFFALFSVQRSILRAVLAFGNVLLAEKQ